MLTAPAHEPTVQVRGLSHSFGVDPNRKQVLYDNDLELLPGEIAIMTGPSGSGKTTLLTLIGALRSVQTGSVRVLGRELASLTAPELVEVRRGIGFIFQAHNLFDSLSALENVRMAVELSVRDRSECDQRSSEMLSRLGLETRIHYKPQALSGGQKQRIAVARALVNRPRLVLADEPTAALDKESGREVVNILKEIAQELSGTVLIVTHDPRIIDVADRIINLVDGRLISDVVVKQAVAISEFLQKCPVFAQQPPAMLLEFAALMKSEFFAPGDVIVRQGDIGDKFYIVASGTVTVTTRKNGISFPPVTLEAGNYFGEVALLTGDPRNATVTAATPVEVLTLAARHFQQALKHSKTFEERLREAIYRRT